MADGNSRRFEARIQRPLSQAVLDGYSKRRWKMKSSPPKLQAHCTPAVRYESGSVMSVYVRGMGWVDIRPRSAPDGGYNGGGNGVTKRGKP